MDYLEQECSYYEKFSGSAADRAKETAQQRDELIKTIKLAEKNLTTERETIQKLKQRIEKLETRSNEALTSDRNSFDKFKTSLRKLTIELKTSEEACEALRDRIIPKKKTELQAARETLRRILDAYLKECKPLNDERVREILDSAVKERGAFYDAFTKIFSDFGAGGINWSNSVQRVTGRLTYEAYDVFGCKERRPDKNKAAWATMEKERQAKRNPGRNEDGRVPKETEQSSKGNEDSRVPKTEAKVKQEQECSKETFLTGEPGTAAFQPVAPEAPEAQTLIKPGPVRNEDGRVPKAETELNHEN